MSKDKLELFDILRKDKKTNADEIKAKNAAKHLLKRLLKKKLMSLSRIGGKTVRIILKSMILWRLDVDLPSFYEKHKNLRADLRLCRKRDEIDGVKSSFSAYTNPSVTIFYSSEIH